MNLTAFFLVHPTATQVQIRPAKILEKANDQTSRFHRNVPKNSSTQAIPRKIMTVKSFGVGASTS
jgi:hypothetical protein